MTSNEELIHSFINQKIDRRSFIKQFIIASGCLSLAGCTTQIKNISGWNSPLSQRQQANVIAVQNHLFPSADNSPSAAQCNSLEYLEFVLLDPALDSRDRNFIINGLNWTNSISYKNYHQDFSSLEYIQREVVFTKIAAKKWGEKWLSAILKYVFEALLTDPIYGGNINEVGWQWLDLQPGYPRPNAENSYPNILKL